MRTTKDQLEQIIREESDEDGVTYASAAVGRILDALIEKAVAEPEAAEAAGFLADIRRGVA